VTRPIATKACLPSASTICNTDDRDLTNNRTIRGRRNLAVQLARQTRVASNRVPIALSWRAKVVGRRVYEIADRHGVDSQAVLLALSEMGAFVRSAASVVDPGVERRLDILLWRRAEAAGGRRRAEAAGGRRRVSATLPRRTTVDNETAAMSSRPDAGRSRNEPVPGVSRPFELRDLATLAHVERMMVEYSEARAHRSALRILDSDFSGAWRQSDGTWVALIQFSSGVSSRLGLTREIVAVYSPFGQLQARFFSNLPDFQTVLPRDRLAEEHIYLVWSRDQSAGRKLAEWSEQAAYTAVALPAGSDPRAVSDYLFRTMHARLGSRNLYDESLPVTGSNFFGRRALLAQLTDEVQRGSVCGAFGLRKAGKTSLLKEVARRYRLIGESQRIFLLRDLESLPSDPVAMERALVADLREAFLAEFRPRQIKTTSLTELTNDASLGDFRRALDKSIRDCAKKDVQVILALDEIESLVGDAAVVRSGGRGFVPEFFGIIRSLVQENENFNALLAGITSAPLDRGQLFDRENPLFGWGKVFYLAQLSNAEITDMTREVGRRMAVDWDDGALERVYRESRGNIYIHRTFAASIVSRMPVGSSVRHVTTDDVDITLRSWRREAVPRFREMLDSTRRHYPDECQLLDVLAESPEAVNEYESAFPSEIARLVSLGLLEESLSGGIRLGAIPAQLVHAGLL
jgi:hypothetical protein